MDRKFQKPKKAFFNLVEVALAIGIVAVGMAGVMGLYPVALKAARNSVAENYSMLSAEQFFCFLEMTADSGWNSFITGVPSSKPTPSQLTSANNWSGNNIGDIYTSGSTLDTGNGIYGIMMKSSSVTDFAAHAVIWKAPLTNSYGVDSPRFFTDSAYQNSAIINIEISWPVEKPYKARDKRIFSVILTKKI